VQLKWPDPRAVFKGKQADQLFGNYILNVHHRQHKTLFTTFSDLPPGSALPDLDLAALRGEGQAAWMRVTDEYRESGVWEELEGD
jgi:hypothetical protein